MNPVYSAQAAARYRIRRPWMSWYRYTRLRWHVLFALGDAVGWCLVGPWKWARAWLREAVTGEPRSILVVQLDHFGDAVMSLGLLRSLRQRFAQARLEVVSSPWNRELFETRGEVDHVHVMEVSRFSRRGRLGWVAALLRGAWRLRRRRFDLAIDVRGEFPHALLIWLAGARHRVGWACGGGGFLLTDRVAYVPGRHEVLSRAAILETLGCDDADPTPRFEPDDEAVQWVRGRLDVGSRPLVVMHVGSGTPAKHWPDAHWRQLFRLVIEETDAVIALMGGDVGPAACLRDCSSQVLDWTGRLPIARLAALLSQADVFVGPDSGPAHFAAAVGTPVVALFSGTNDPQQWKPWGRRVAIVRHAPACSPCHRETCPWADHPCMVGLRPEAVMEPIRRILRPGVADTRTINRDLQRVSA